MSLGGTASYAGFTAAVPDRVRGAVATAGTLGFECCVRPEIGRLLTVLAEGLPSGAASARPARARVPASRG
jgi:hypothetical protein